MRRRKAENSRRVNGQLEVEFSGISLTSYAGLELFLRYFRAIGLNGLIRQHLSKCGLSGDFGVVGMFRLLLVLLLVGGSRLRHVLFLEDDPLVQRFCGLWHLPSPRTISRWLKQFTMASVQYLQKLNAVIVGSVVETLPLGTLTWMSTARFSALDNKRNERFGVSIRTIVRCPATIRSLPSWRRPDICFA